MNVYQAVFVDPWPWWAAGGAIGLFVIAFAWVLGKALGVSSGFGTVCGLGSKLPAWKRKPYADGWRLWFLVGLPIGGLASAALAGGLRAHTELGAFDAAFAAPLWVKASMLLAGGLLVGFGARWAGGCTSGHAIVGTALGAKSSIAAMMAFMAAGVAVTWLLYGLLGARS